MSHGRREQHVAKTDVLGIGRLAIVSIIVIQQISYSILVSIISECLGVHVSFLNYLDSLTLRVYL